MRDGTGTALYASEEYIRARPRRPDCLVAKYCNPWTAGVCDCSSAAPPTCSLPCTTCPRAARNLRCRTFPCAPLATRRQGHVLGLLQWLDMEKEHRRDVLNADATADGLPMDMFCHIKSIFGDAYATALVDVRSCVKRPGRVRGRTQRHACAIARPRRVCWHNLVLPNNI